MWESTAYRRACLFPGCLAFSVLKRNQEESHHCCACVCVCVCFFWGGAKKDTTTSAANKLGFFGGIRFQTQGT